METNYINREVSWLSFNERVLQEAADQDVPLLERLKFLGIFSSNLDEFYRVRVANLHRLIDFREFHTQPQVEEPEEVLKELQDKILDQRMLFDQLYVEIKKELAEEGIHLINERQVKKWQEPILKDYFKKSVLQKLVPILISNERDFPMLQDKIIYLAVLLKDTRKNLKSSYALIEIPTQVINRFYVFPKKNGQHYIILLDDIIRFNMKEIFSIFNYNEFESYNLKVSRDAELDVDDDIALSFLERMSKSLKERETGRPVRLSYDKTMPDKMLRFFCKKLGLTDDDHLLPGGRYHNFKDFMDFPAVGRKGLTYSSFQPQRHHRVPNGANMFEMMRQGDLLMNYPYHSFDYTIELLREAALDPYVTEINITLYRVANPSNIVSALLNAIKNGKEVTVLVELQARFDEEANIQWANRLMDEGAKVIEGVPGLKVHSKIVLVKRVENNRLERFGIIGTGNFHEKTARLYSDTALYTADERILEEIEQVFQFFETNYRPGSYKHLLVAPFHMRERFYEFIDREIAQARKNRRAGIKVKINNLVDRGMIDKLYEASQVGVKIKLIIRGICGLVPGVKGLSDNIEAISIVDKFLEHSRVFIFENAGDPTYYISSADWMGRNLNRRVEVAVPIYSDELKQEIADFFEIQWRDNSKARLLDDQQNNRYRKRGKRKYRAQVALERYYIRKLKQDN